MSTMKSSQHKLHVLVDTKNLALYSGGISGFFKPLLLSWVSSRPEIQFSLVSPMFNLGVLNSLPNCRFHEVPWPSKLPRPMRHPFYDNFIFPRSIRRIQPDFVFTPYHDVRLPKKIPSVMTIHDTCFSDLPHVYPLRIRAYYLHMLRRNLKRVSHVVTVSESSKKAISSLYGLNTNKISVIPNCTKVFDCRLQEDVQVAANKLKADDVGVLKVFYVGGSDFRKNIGKLLEAVKILIFDRKIKAKLAIAGEQDAGWERELAKIPIAIHENIVFLGRIDQSQLVAHYQASDVVVYPSLGEGFGRVGLEAMELGVPLACSDLPVLHEVLGDYPEYFNPLRVEEIVESIIRAAAKGRVAPKRDDRFDPIRVQQLFIQTMDNLLMTAVNRAKS